MSCNPTKNLDFHLMGGRWWTLTGPSREPRRDQEQGGGAGLRNWTSFASVVLLLNSCATDIVLVTLLSTAVETAVAKYTSCYAMAKEYCLNIFVVLAAVHGLLGLPVWSAQSRLHSLSPPPPAPPPPLSLISHLASVDVKQNVYLPTLHSESEFTYLLYTVSLSLNTHFTQ